MKYPRVAALVLFIMSSPLFGQHPMEDRGFSPNRVYSFHGIDSVNPFNGNANIRIALGDALQLSDRLSYELAIYNNSKVWRYDVDAITGRIRSIPLRCNTGMGWRFSFARLFPGSDPTTDLLTNQWTFQTPDGAVHSFYPQLHGGSGGTTDLQYSRDGSYLRLKTISTTEREVHVPDGTIYVFRRLQRRYPQTGAWAVSTTGTWWLVTMKDAFANKMEISYETTSSHKEVWNVTDNGRTITVKLKHSPISDLDTELDFIDVTRFGGATVRYSFSYQDLRIPPAYADNTYAPGTTLPVRVLTGITPTDTDGTALANGYSMMIGTTPAYDTTEVTPGVLKRLVLPTLGSIGWEHDIRIVPVVGSSPLDTPVVVTKRYVCDPAVSSNCGADVSPTPTWTYGALYGGLPRCEVLCPDGAFPCYSGRPRQLTTWIKEPAGENSQPRTTVTYFSAYRHMDDPDGDTCPENGWSTAEFGLPFTRYASEEGRFLSMEIRLGFADSDTRNWNGEGAMPDAAGNRVKHRTYVRYALDVDADPRFQGFDFNPRVESTSTRYVADAGCSGTCVRRTEYGNFDGFGNFRQTSTNDNFGGTGNFRTTFVNYTAPSNNWIAGTSSEQCVADETTARSTAPASAVKKCSDLTAAAVTITKYDLTKGTLEARRILKNAGTDLSKEDLLSTFTYDTRGTLTTEKYYGGDTQDLDDTVPYDDPRAFNPPVIPATSTTSETPAPPEYQITHTPTYHQTTSVLTKLTSQYSNNVSIRDEDYDRWTGLVTAAGDVSGLTTSYTYDVLGRISGATLPGASTTSYSYSDASHGTTFAPAKVLASQATTSEGSVSQEYQYDGLGRLWREKTKQAAGTWSMVQTTYDNAGHVSKVSMPQVPASETSFVPSHETKYSIFDESGAATRIESPDSKIATVTRSGVRAVQRTSKVTTPLNADETATTTEVYDARSRLITVKEASGPTSAQDPIGDNASTSYSYDSSDRLTSVRMSLDSGGTAQVRTFTYDNRGFLLSETHPELGASGQGTITYSSYDARGHLRERTTGTTTLTFDFDAAERQTGIAKRVGRTSTPLKSFEYATANTTTNFKKGKLETAISHNSLSSAGNIRVTETYAYESPTGLTTKCTTLVERVSDTTATTVQSFEHQLSYDQLRKPKTITMPTCSFHSCTSGGGIASFVYGRSNGFLTSIGRQVGETYYGYGNLAYHASGMINTVEHRSSPAATDTYEAANGLPQPSKILFSGGTACPGIGSSPITAPSTICSGASGSASVPGRAAEGVTHTWAIMGGTLTSPSAGDSITFTAGAAGTVTLTVTAQSQCGMSAGSTKSIEIPSPTATLTTPSTTILRGASVTLTVTLTGPTPRRIVWSDGVTEENIVSDNWSRSVTPQITTTYGVSSMTAGGCTGTTSGATTVTVIPPAPASVDASTQQNRTVLVTWAPVSGAAFYQIERRTQRDGIGTVIGSSETTAFIDSAPESGHPVTYVYYVRTIDAAGTLSGYGAYDHATCATALYQQPQLVAGVTLVRAADLAELRSAVDAMRYAFYLSPGSYGPTSVIRASDFGEIIGALDSVRALTGVGPFQYAGVPAPAPGGIVLAAHVQQLRDALR